jgi:endonuclease III-like uncharacterized protein
MSNKILVYDTSRGFSRFIKSKLESQFEVEVINNKKDIKKYNITDFKTIFFIVNDVLDSLVFSSFYYDVSTVFLGITIKNLENRFENYDNIISINLDLTKKELLQYINNQLELQAS